MKDVGCVPAKCLSGSQLCHSGIPVCSGMDSTLVERERLTSVCKPFSILALKALVKLSHIYFRWPKEIYENAAMVVAACQVFSLCREGVIGECKALA